jgi:hypothetical protein
LKKIVVVGFFYFLNFAQYITFPTHPSTSFCNKHWLIYQRKYDGEIVEKRKVGNPVVFFWDAFWLNLQLQLFIFC